MIARTETEDKLATKVKANSSEHSLLFFAVIGIPFLQLFHQEFWRAAPMGKNSVTRQPCETTIDGHLTFERSTGLRRRSRAFSYLGALRFNCKICCESAELFLGPHEPRERLSV